MYLGISVENFVTVGLILLVWMILLHVMGQLGLNVAQYVPGLGGGKS